MHLLLFLSVFLVIFAILVSWKAEAESLNKNNLQRNGTRKQRSKTARRNLTEPTLSPDQQLDEMFKNDVSVSTYFTVKNISTDYKFNFNATEVLAKRLMKSNRTAGQFYSKDGLLRAHRQTSDAMRNMTREGRRQLGLGLGKLWPWTTWNLDFDYDKSFVHYGCMMITNSYTNAFIDFRRYFPMRILYADNMEYEFGYIIYNIVHKYQSVLETFKLAYDRYGMANKTDLAPVQYMFYLYRVIAQGCKVIIHLCNMLHELKRKYKGHKTVFSVITEDDLKRKRKKRPPGFKKVKSYKDKNKAAEEERKQRRKDIARGLMRLTKPTLPRRGPFPLEYGWSIEDFWLHENINSTI